MMVCLLRPSTVSPSRAAKVSEFSAGTADEARFACTDRAVLRVYLQEQLSAWDEVGLQGAKSGFERHTGDCR